MFKGLCVCGKELSHPKARRCDSEVFPREKQRAAAVLSMFKDMRKVEMAARFS